MKVIMGDKSYGSIKVVGGCGKVIVGKYTSIADGVTAVMVGHGVHNVSTFPFNSKHFKWDWPEAGGIIGHPTHDGDIVIGSDCWVGYNSIILSGVEIGNGAIIAAGSVVTSAVKPYSVVGGVPARFIKYRFEQNVIASLLEIAWWHWPETKVRENVKWFCGDSINEFISKFGGM